MFRLIKILNGYEQIPIINLIANKSLAKLNPKQLAGIIAGLAAKMEDLSAAVRLGVFLHGAAGDTGRGAVIADELPALAAKAAAYQTWW